ncbi:MAG: DUF4304 domain-containing protein [Solirubrobacteraceae bacterium]
MDEWFAWRRRHHTPASAGSVTAQALYDDLVKGAIIPALRALGFTGSGGRYSLRADGAWALLGFQKSAYSDGNEVRFTVNLLVTSNDDWAELRAQKPYLPARPSPTTRYGDPVAQERIGQLLPEPADSWWRVYDGVNLDDVAENVIETIERNGIPWLRTELAQREHPS